MGIITKYRDLALVAIFLLQMTEKDFWTKYFRAEYHYSTKNTAVAEAEAAEDEVLSVFLKPDEILAQEARPKVIVSLLQYLMISNLRHIHLILNVLMPVD